jgi:IS30 family transposase
MPGIFLGIFFAKVTSKQVAEVERKLNSRPRKCLDFKTPHDFFDPPPPIALAA